MRTMKRPLAALLCAVLCILFFTMAFWGAGHILHCCKTVEKLECSLCHALITVQSLLKRLAFWACAVLLLALARVLRKATMGSPAACSFLETPVTLKVRLNP